MNKKILIPGVSGSGKSTLEAVFSAKGYRTADIDRGFAEWQYIDSGKALGHHPQDADELSLLHWALKVGELQFFLDGAESGAMVFGSTNDLYKHVGMFDGLILLNYPDKESVVGRLLSRPDGDYGKTPHERDSVISYMDDYQDTMKKLGATVIDCTLPLNDVVDIIESEIADE